MLVARAPRVGEQSHRARTLVGLAEVPGLTTPPRSWTRDPAGLSFGMAPPSRRDDSGEARRRRGATVLASRLRERAPGGLMYLHPFLNCRGCQIAVREFSVEERAELERESEADRCA